MGHLLNDTVWRQFPKLAVAYCLLCQISAKRLNWCSIVKAKEAPMMMHNTTSSAFSTRGEGFVGRPSLLRIYSRKKM